MRKKPTAWGVPFFLKPSKMDELEEALVYMTGVLDAAGRKDKKFPGRGGRQ